MPIFLSAFLLIFIYALVRKWSRSDHAQRHSGLVFLAICFLLGWVLLIIWPLVLLIGFFLILGYFIFGKDKKR